MMKVAVYVDNGGSWQCDCTSIEQGNPGMAGTPYVMNLIGVLLQRRDNDIESVLLTHVDGHYADDVHTTTVGSLAGAMSYAEAHNYDFLVFKHYERYEDAVWTQLRACHFHTRFVIHCHNFVSCRMLRAYARLSRVARLVTVGREQMDLYRDHAAFRKSDYIFNPIDMPSLTTSAMGDVPFAQRNHRVAYMGALIAPKGFYVLAKAWKKVLKKVPDAELIVLGTGRLYGGNAETGPLGVADRAFEERFLPWLSDDQGQLLPGVHFLGIKGGEEKRHLLQSAKVGVPNPTGNSETFCVCGVEMQIAGERLAAICCEGFLDTCFNASFFRYPHQLARTIIRELNNTEDLSADVLQRINEVFSQETVIRDWERLFHQVLSGEDGSRPCSHLHPILPLVHPCFRMKWLKDILRRMKDSSHVLSLVLPTVETVCWPWNKVRAFLFRHGV